MPGTNLSLRDISDVNIQFPITDESVLTYDSGTGKFVARTPAALEAALNPLGRYSNVVVVDPSGAGDYTTLTAAMAAITDSTTTNRYVVLLFGAISVPANTDVVVPDGVDLFGFYGSSITFTTSSRGLGFTGSSNLTNVNLIQGRIKAAATGKTVTHRNGWYAYLYMDGAGTTEFYNCFLVRATAIAGGAGGTYRLFGCMMYSATSAAFSVSQALNVLAVGTYFYSGVGAGFSITTPTGSANVQLVSCFVHGEFGLVIESLPATSVLRVRGGALVGNDTGLQFSEVSALLGTYQVTNVSIEGGTNSVWAGTALTGAAVYQCALRGAVYNTTFAAGTAAESNTIL